MILLRPMSFREGEASPRGSLRKNRAKRNLRRLSCAQQTSLMRLVNVSDVYLLSDLYQCAKDARFQEFEVFVSHEGVRHEKKQLVSCYVEGSYVLGRVYAVA